MQNKKNVVFITPQSGDGQAGKRLKRLLNKDAGYSCSIANEKDLRCFIRTAIIDKFVPTESVVRKKYFAFRRKLLAKRKADFSYGTLFGLPEKTTLHLIRRFMPKAVVISTPQALRACFAVLKKNGMQSLIFVLFSDLFCREDLPMCDDVCYFVNTEDDRKKLLSWGVSEEKIGLDPQCVDPEELRINKEEARKTLGLDAEKKIIVVYAEDGGAAFERILTPYMTENHEEEIWFLCGQDKKARSFLAGYNVNMASDENEDDWFSSADVIVTAPDVKRIGKACKQGKQVVVFCPDGEKERAAYFSATCSDCVKGAEDGKSFVGAVDACVSTADGTVRYGLVDLLADGIKDLLSASVVLPDDEPNAILPAEEEAENE